MEKKMILASHGNMAEGMLNSIQMVIGNTDDLSCLGLKPGQNPEELTAELECMIHKDPTKQFLILADIRGGSVSNSIMRLTNYENVKLVNGMNLTLAIGLYLTDGALSDEEIEVIAADARDGLALVKRMEQCELDCDEII